MECLLPGGTRYNTVGKVSAYLAKKNFQEMQMKCCVNKCMLFNITIDHEIIQVCLYCDERNNKNN